MKIIYALLALIILVLLVSGGVGWLEWEYFFGVVIPYIAIIVFIVGFIYRVIKWARSPVPFHIPTVAGQQKSLPWIKDDRIESPSTATGVIIRMTLEVLLFRSLFRNDRVELRPSKKLLFSNKKFLWLGGLALHWSLFIILFRHLRLFTEPVPSVVLFAQDLDSIIEFLLPTLFITDLIILVALSYLILRRFFSPQVRYISLTSDYFAVFLIFGVAVSGILMRLFFRVDVEAVKELAMGVISLNPVLPAGLTLTFYIHLFLICALLAYFPFSKLMHGAGVLLSPTRNLLNNSRQRRHVNPWSYPVKVHSYEEYEDEFREKMKNVGLPVERE